MFNYPELLIRRKAGHK